MQACRSAGMAAGAAAECSGTKAPAKAAKATDEGGAQGPRSPARAARARAPRTAHGPRRRHGIAGAQRVSKRAAASVYREGFHLGSFGRRLAIISWRLTDFETVNSVFYRLSSFKSGQALLRSHSQSSSAEVDRGITSRQLVHRVSRRRCGSALGFPGRLYGWSM